ncbi:MAG: menaquinone biosynthesis protein [Candidatus Rokubacteria bacterium]|nr:menaquinone biosynthesis protein [Candidatus Rokubacteria bacterium]
MLRLGHIPYLNCEPFFAHLRGFDLRRLTPRELGRAMAAETVEAGLLSLVDFLTLEEALTPLPFGIATPGPARSVLLFSNRPLAELGGGVIGVTNETSTSVELLKILLARRYEAVPRAWVGPDEPSDAVLLIGDEAIRVLNSGSHFAHLADLGSEWAHWTGLPCVFARWAVRTSVPEAERLALWRALNEALDQGLSSLPVIARRRRDTGWSEAEVLVYLRGFTYRLGAEEEKAIAEFMRLRGFLENGSC